MNIYKQYSVIALLCITTIQISPLPITFERLVRNRADGSVDYIDLVGDIHTIDPSLIKERAEPKHDESLHQFIRQVSHLSAPCKVIVEHPKQNPTGHFIDAFARALTQMDPDNLTIYPIDGRHQKYTRLVGVINIPLLKILAMDPNSQDPFFHSSLSSFTKEMKDQMQSCSPWLDYIDEPDINALFIPQDALYLSCVQNDLEKEATSWIDDFTSSQKFSPNMPLHQWLRKHHKSSSLFALAKKLTQSYLEMYLDLQLLLEICGSNENHRIVYSGAKHTTNISDHLKKIGYHCVYENKPNVSVFTKEFLNSYSHKPWALPIETWKILDSIPTKESFDATK